MTRLGSDILCYLLPLVSNESLCGAIPGERLSAIHADPRTQDE